MIFLRTNGVREKERLFSFNPCNAIQQLVLNSQNYKKKKKTNRISD